MIIVGSIIVMIATGLILVAVACGTAYTCGGDAMRKKAVDAGVGEWRADKYGNRTWHWKEEKK